MNAKWTRNISNSNISWTKVNITSPVSNFTHYSKSGYYPTPGNTYLSKVEYIDFETIFSLFRQNNFKKSVKQKIEDELKKGITEKVAVSIIKKFFGVDVDIAIAQGVLEIIASFETDKDWNAFVETTKCYMGIKKTTYMTFVKYRYWGPLNNGTTSYGWNYAVKEAYSYKYELWDGNGKVNPPSGYSGSWNYTFK